MLFSLTSSVAALSVLGSLVSAGHMEKNRLPAHHNMLGRALQQNETESFSGLGKRAFHGQATWYKVGLGACGEYSKPSDFIVALNSAQYGGGYPGPQCFKGITITANGKSAHAVIMDECPTCDYGSLDLSESLFQHFASLGTGVFPISWSFGGSGGGGGDDDDNDSEDKERESKSSVSEKSTASVESVSRESRASISSKSSVSERSEESEASKASKASVSSVSEFSVTSVAALATSEAPTSTYVDDLPAETGSSSSSFSSATISGNNLGLSLQILKQFGNLAAVGATKS